MNFKVKVYLSPSKEVQVIDGVHFVAYLTRWTFAETNYRTEHWRNNETETDPLCSYTYQMATYTDGSAWPLSEIDSCIDLEDIEIIGSYEVFSRGLKALPMYETRHLKTRPEGPPATVYSYEEVCNRFPIALIWGGAVIDNHEFLIDKKTKQLKRITSGVAFRQVYTSLHEELEPVY